MAISSPSGGRRAAGAVLVLCLAATLWAAPRASAAAIETEAAQPSIFGANLEAEIDPLGEETSCKVEYTPAVAFEENEWIGASEAPCSPKVIGSAAPAQRVTAGLSGLAADSEYHYRFVATAGGETLGPGGTFHTYGVEDFTVEARDESGSSLDDAAGSHPYELVTVITMPHGEVNKALGAAGLTRDTLAELPSGLVGDPGAVDRCPLRLAEERKCSGNSQVGVIRVIASGPPGNQFESQIFNVAPAIGEPARLAGEINTSINAYIDTSVRTGSDYGITAGGFGLPTQASPFAFEIRLWGVPADPSHDGQRWCPEKYGVGCSVTPGTPEKPFLRNPTSCTGPLQARVKVDSYNLPGTFFSKAFEMPAITGCDQLEFQPSLEVRPTTAVADSPTGLHVDLHVPQHEGGDELATPDLREAVVKLPLGLTLNPSSASGLQSCTPAQIGLTTPVGVTPIHTTPAPAQCPDAAKVGTVEVDTPLLDHPLPGSVYIATPYENPFNSLLAIYIAVDDPESGIVIKLAGQVEIGPDGQLTTTFDENPQLPFEDFKLDFFGGPRAALKTPALCGSYSTTSSLTPWSAPESGPPATPSDGYQVSSHPSGGACPTSADQQPNHPAFEAGSESTLAGAFSPFIVRLTREDGSQQFSSLTVTPPPGLLGRLAGVPYCPDSALAAAAGKSGAQERASASCPAASEVGIANVGAGAGPSPYYVQGHAYLAGPYKGAPLSLAIVTPAVAGPYDLGTVVVRSALEVDPVTSQITVKSDPIPSELKGIPLDVRSIAVKMSRPKFTLNPTNCEAMSVGAALTSTVSQTVPLSNRFQVGGCGKLGFKPRLQLKVKGSTRRRAHPKIIATLTPRRGDANVAYARVKLPHAMFIDNARLGNICTRPAFAEENCPPSSWIGKARATTPLLDYPLHGKVFLKSNPAHQLPDVAVLFKGPPSQPIKFALAGKTDSVHGALRNTFEATPDVPVTKFRLELFGGKKGLVILSSGLCARPQAHVLLKGQNGKEYETSPKVKTSCKKR